MLHHLASVSFALLCIIYCIATTSTAEHECRLDTGSPNTVNLTIGSTRSNRTGHWVTDFFLSKTESNVEEHDDVTLHLSQGITTCSGKRMLHIRGVLTNNRSSHWNENKADTNDRLLFHTKCGSNVAVLNHGRTARKINLEIDGHGIVFTQRPLKDDEVLEVTLEKKHTKFNHALGIGIATVSPMDIQIPQHINSITNSSWAMYHANSYLNGKEAVKNYGKSLDALQVGDRVGVMRSNTGSLHFYVNGEDQGPAASNIPHTVYGLVELWGDAAMVTIVDS